MSKLLRRVALHFENRLFELSSTSMMLGLAGLIALWPEAMAASAFRYLLAFISPGWLGSAFFLAGCLRLAALVANGEWPRYGPILRAIGAFAGAMLWGQMGFALFQLMPNVGTPPSPGIPVYLVLSLFELFSMYRALVLVNHDQVP